jgi:hypothetical protein
MEAQFLLWLDDGREVDVGFLSFIVMEPGSQWPGHVGDVENLVAVGVEEENDELPLRIRAKLEVLRHSGKSVRVGVLACSTATDEVSTSRRARVARELLTAVAGAGFGRLVLTAGNRSSSTLRLDLLRLCEELRGTSAVVSVRFPEEGRLGLGLVPSSGARRALGVMGGVAMETV